MHEMIWYDECERRVVVWVKLFSLVGDDLDFVVAMIFVLSCCFDCCRLL